MDTSKLCPHCLKQVVNINEVKNCPHCGKDVKTVSQVQHQLRPQTILAGKYLLGDVLGEGGFGITYIGYDLNLEMRVAVKEFYPNGYAAREANSTTALTVYAGSNQESVQKWRDNFIKEARSLAKCSHLSGVVGVKDFFQENNTAYIILEYLEGTTLKSYVKQQGGKVSYRWLLGALESVIVSLGEVHKGGLIHRDISPDNIMLLPDGSMKLLDFGAARDYTESGEKSLSVMLKPGYAPEEQYRSKGVQGPWSDVYAMAGTIYRCITGVTPVESMERIRKDELKKPSELGIEIDPKVEEALMKGLAVFAEDRYQNMEQFHEGMYAGAKIGERAKAVVLPAAVTSQEPVTPETSPVSKQPSVSEQSVVLQPSVPGAKDMSQATTKVNEILTYVKQKPAVLAVVAGFVVCVLIGVAIGNMSVGPATDKVAKENYTRQKEWDNAREDEKDDENEEIPVDESSENSGEAKVSDSIEATLTEAEEADTSAVEMPTETAVESSEVTEVPQYILPESDSRFLTRDDLIGFTQEDCRIARNELFARHGRIFQDEMLQAYFESCDWYQGTVLPEDFDEAVFNEYELANRDLIVEFEKEQGYR